MPKQFVHLHVHTEYSLLDGLSKIGDLLTYVKENNMDSLAITDHGAMYGAIDFYKKAISKEIKPIIGMEGYIAQSSIAGKPEKGTATAGQSGRQNFHLILLAKNLEGYQNLMELSSKAHLDGYYYRPRFDHEILRKYAKGLVCTSACGLGEISQALIGGDYKKAKSQAEWYLDIFEDDFYLEIQRHKYKEYAPLAENIELKREILQVSENEDIINKGIIKLSRDLGIPLVATNDSHYTRKQDATAQDALVCIATGKKVTDSKRLRFIDSPTFYITTPLEMQELFSDIPEAVDNTIKIADKCNLKLTLGKWFFPKFPLPSDLTPDEYLTKLVNDRLSSKVEKVTKEIKERLKYELDIIIKKGYAPYFLIVTDMVNWANEKGIITNTRGSVAGSLVSYVLGITTVDPITYYLPFERFLNPFRPSPPDIDLDIADDRRDEVINYICEKYGYDRVAQICTFGRMLSRAAVRDIARVLGYPYSIGDRIAKLIPFPKQGFPITIPRALEEVEELRNFYKEDSDAKKILDLAMQIEGNVRHISVHAAGLVVSPTKLIDFSPLQKEPSGEKIITQYEMHACEDVGLIKFDILGIRNLSILGSAIHLVEVIEGKKVDIHKIPLDDKKTFKMLGKGETMGVFQLSSGGMTKYIKDLKPTKIEDLMALVALYRPGPISVIPEYIRRKRNPKLIKYLDPRMKRFLEASYGLLVYQDDLLFCALVLAGYSWEETDKFRKAVGKKIPEEMAAQKEKFIKGVIENGQTKNFAENLWKLFEPFQAYGFNKAHAASYGLVAYQTAYMKANYPVEYMTALLTAESNDVEKVSGAINECRRMGIKVLAPDINESDIDFKIVKDKNSLNEKGIRFGLSAIKNVGDAAVRAILEERNKNKFVSFTDFLIKVDFRKVNKRVLESLIKVGALSRFGGRAALLSSMDEIRGKISKKVGNEKQPGLFGVDEDNKNIKASDILKIVPEFTDEELQTLEKQLLGFSLSAKPISEILADLAVNASHKIFELTEDELINDPKVTIAAVIKNVRVIIAKRSGQEMAFVRAEDETGSVELIVFPKIFTMTRNSWFDNKPILISGKVDKRDEDINLIVEDVFTMEGDKPLDRLFIRVPRNVSKESLTKLKRLLLENSGNKSVTLVFEESRKKLDLGLKISWNETLARKISETLENQP